MGKNCQLTLHARVRSAQRGLSLGDIELVRSFGTPVEGGYLLREKEAREEARRWRQRADRLERLAGARVVDVDGCIVTVYHAARSTEEKLLRGAHERDLYQKCP